MRFDKNMFLESMIDYQGIKDPIVNELREFHSELKRLAISYYKDRKIDIETYNEEYENIAGKYADIIEERFGFAIKIIDFDTYAILPLLNYKYNEKVMGVDIGKLRREIRSAEKKIMEFSEWIKSNEIIIDLKRAKILNLPKKFRVVMLCSAEHTVDLSPDEFAAIILHEIGHLFTLLESYYQTEQHIIRYVDDFIKNYNPAYDGKIVITGKDPDELDDSLKSSLVKYVKDFDKILFRNIKYPTRFNEDTEFEADDFAAKFGLGDALLSALNKLMHTDFRVFYNLPFILILSILFTEVGLMLVLYAIFGGGLFLSFAIMMFVIIFAVRVITAIVAMINYDNASRDEHSTPLKRYREVKSSLIRFLRSKNLPLDVKHEILITIDRMDKEITKLEKSIYGKVLTGLLLSGYYTPSISVNEKWEELLEKMIDNNMYLYSVRTELLVKELQDFVSK